MFTRRFVLTDLSGIGLAACAHRASPLRIPAASARRRIEDLVLSAMVPAAGLVVWAEGEIIFSYADGLARGAAGEAEAAAFTPETPLCVGGLLPHSPAASGSPATFYSREDEGGWQVQACSECPDDGPRASLIELVSARTLRPDAQIFQPDSSPIPGITLAGYIAETCGASIAMFQAPGLNAAFAFAVTGTSASGRAPAPRHPVMTRATEPLWLASAELFRAV